MTAYDWQEIDRFREAGWTWGQIVAHGIGISEDVSTATLRKAHSRRTDKFTPPRNPGMKILGIDIETAPNVAHVWGLFKQNIGTNQILQTGRVMCWAARWFSDGEDATTVFMSEYQHGHEAMVRGAWRLLDEADAVVHYNGTRFDVPTLNREFLKLGLAPPSPYAEVDLLRTARKRFRFASNRLDHLLKELKIGEKVRHDGHSLWVGCMNGDHDSWVRMEEYNRGDVDQMDTLYRVLLPWISNHPNHALYQDTDRPVCTNCGGTSLHSRGTQRTKTQMYRRFQCQDCGTWVRERFTSVDKDKRRHILTQAV